MRTWRKRNPFTLLVGMKTSTTTLEKNLVASLKSKQIYHLIQQYHSLGYTQKNVTQVTPEAPVHPCLLQHYSQ
jgi:hypothetical protein